MGIGRTNAGGGSGAGGATLVVNTPADVVVTAVNDTLNKTFTRTSNWEGKAIFKGLSTGTWALTMKKDEQVSAPTTILITADYETTLKFFTAYIDITYPVGSTCVCEHENGIKFTAPDVSGTWRVTVPNTGSWNISCSEYTDGTGETASAVAEITTEGEAVSIELTYNVYLYKIGNTYSDITGGWSKTGYSYGDSTASYTTKSPTIDSNGMKLAVTADSQAAISGMQKKYTGFKDYSYLNIVVEEVTPTNNSIYVCANTTKKVWDTGNTAQMRINNTGIVQFPLTKLTSADGYYIAFAVFGADFATSQSIRISAVYLT